MDAAAWQRLSAWLDEALDLSAAERGAWLAALRAREPALAPRLERMLLAALASQGGQADDDATNPAAHAAGEGIGAATAGAAASGPREAAAPAAIGAGFAQQLAQALKSQPRAELLPPQPGQRLGAWRLLHLLGEGGMGEVWLAERADGLFEARAAIKLLRHDLTGPGLAARFARERAVLARLTHPGIARLLDAGEEAPAQGGRAYLVIEHIEGSDLATHVRSRALPVAARVRLLLAVCRAVEHAHAQLIVHRDLKPGNVMVTPAGEPKLLDFGIAALLGDDGSMADTQLTRQAGRRLTPAYAAPEQILGAPIGVAADVYSLGVMLYELLAGVLPFGVPAGASRMALEHAVLHTEARRLTRTTVDPAEPGAAPRGPGRPPDFERARGDLEAIAAKALRKRPAERYGSVTALAEDLDRWLTHRPVSVRREDRWHRARLWLRRNAALSAATAAVTLSLAAGMAAALSQRERAQQAAETSDQVTAYLAELLSSANPDRYQGRVPTVIDLLERSRAELPTRFPEHPATQARLLEVLVTTYRDLNRFDLAIPLAEQLIAFAEQHFGADDPRAQDASVNLARIYTSQGSPAKVLALIEPLHPRWLRRHGEVSLPHANLLYLQALAYARVGRFAESEAVLARTRPIVDALHRPEEFEHLFFENYVHVLRMAQGRYREAEAVLAATAPRWDAADPRFARFIIVLRRNQLMAQRRQALPQDFEPRVQALMQAADDLLGPGNDLTAGLRAELARHHLQLGDAARAAALQRDNAAAMTGAGVQHPSLTLPPRAQRLLSEALSQPEAPWRPAAQSLLDKLAGTPAVSGPARVETAHTLARVALHGAAFAAGRGAALALADRALALAEADPVLTTHAGLASRGQQLRAQWHRARGDAAAALPLLRARLAWLAEQPEPGALDAAQAVWTAHIELALVLQMLGDATAAVQRDQALRARPAALPTPHPLDGLLEQVGPGPVSRTAGGAAHDALRSHGLGWL